VTGFALANRSAVNQLHPSLDFAGLEIEREYRSMAALPLFKDEMLLGALSVYSTELDYYTDDHMRLLETVHTAGFRRAFKRDAARTGPNRMRSPIR